MTLAPIHPLEPSVEVTLDIALAHYAAGELADAERACRMLLQEQPGRADVLHLLGRVTLKAGNPGIAVAFLRRAVALDPGQAASHDNLGKALLRHGKPQDAKDCFERALALEPDFLRAQLHLGAARRDVGDTEGAIAAFERAIDLQPDLPLSYINLAIVLMDAFRLEAAEVALRKALELDPQDVNALANLGGALMNQGRLDESIAVLRRSIEFCPEFLEGHSNLLFALHYPSNVGRDELAREALGWAERHARALLANARPHDNPPDPERRLRIGYVSADFHRHPVGYFLEAVARNHDKSQVEVFCYSNHRGVDDLTLRLRPSVDHWRTVVGVTDEVLADVVRRDGIDILVDLSGHTGGHRLPLFARKPAPVQVTWAGYFDTTGLDTIDYIVLDKFVCPAGDEDLYSERVLRLPDGYLCYTPQSTQAIAPLPAATRGHITFGCFNKVSKITPAVVAVWARILHASPGARLLLKDTAFDDRLVRERYARLFAEQRIPSERLTFQGRSPYQEYIDAYGEVDIGLDPFPFNGGTTTVESLWMGVPVVTLAGDRFVSRMGVSHLSNVGLTGLIAETPDAYVQTAVRLAADIEGLSALRTELRQRMTSSPLCDGARFTRALEELYRQMWRTWCESAQAPY